MDRHVSERALLQLVRRLARKALSYVPRILDLYTQSETGKTPRKVAGEILTDLLFACPARRTASTVTRAGFSVYRYVFAYHVRMPVWGELYDMVCVCVFAGGCSMC